MALILLITSLIECNPPFLVEGDGYSNPYGICERYGYNTAEATSYNLCDLRKQLAYRGYPNAAVNGWDGVRKDMVVWENGTVAPYDKYTNRTRNAFCEDRYNSYPDYNSYSNCKPRYDNCRPSYQPTYDYKYDNCIPICKPRYEPCVPICKPCIPICPPTNPSYDSYDSYDGFNNCDPCGNFNFGCHEKRRHHGKHRKHRDLCF